ncbi:MAG: TetR/AcrR family transcriptional regulator [Chloroflexota bacterium]
MPRPDVSEERKDQILQAAMQVAARKGYNSTRMNDVAREAGLSVGILYWYFKGKVEITLALMDILLASDVAALQAALAAPGTCRARLWALFIRSVDEINPQVQSLWLEMNLHAAREPKIRRKLLDYQIQYRALTAQIIAQGIERGELRADLDAQVAAYALQILFDGFMMNLSARRDAAFPEDFRQSFNLFWDGLTP